MRITDVSSVINNFGTNNLHSGCKKGCGIHDLELLELNDAQGWSKMRCRLCNKMFKRGYNGTYLLPWDEPSDNEAN